MSIRNPKRHPCASCGIVARSVTGYCRDCRPARVAKRPERPCSGCTKPTTGRHGLCIACRNRRADLYALPTMATNDIFALTGGEWQTRPGGIKIWVTRNEAA